MITSTIQNSTIQRTVNSCLKYLVLFGLALTVGSCSQGDPSAVSLIRSEANSSLQNMYVIERDIIGAGNLSQEDLKKISIESCVVLEKMGSEINWLYSYVTEDIIYCVFTAANEGLVVEHAKIGGFPANSISQVYNIIDPSTSK